MPSVDFSMLDKGSLTTLRQVTLGDYIIELAWSPNGTKIAVVTVEGLSLIHI